MISTPRFDSLTAGGTDGVFDGIRLADGHVLTLNTQPGAAVAEEVFLYPGLTVPDTEAWENQDDLEGFLTGGGLRGGLTYLDVPIEAVRELIVQHGGEHENQEPPAPDSETDAETDAEAEGDKPVLDLFAVADLRGRFADGYSADGIRSVFGRIYDEGGPYLVCVWEYADVYGFGGSSQFYAEGEDGAFFEVQPDIHQWLSGQEEKPGPVDGWICAPATGPTEFPVSDDFHNYARIDRAGGERVTTNQLFTVEGTTYGPYEALPVSDGWSTYSPISVTRATAEQIAEDLNVRDAGCGLTAEWTGEDLVFTWGEPFADMEEERIAPDADGRYLIGGLWPWIEVQTERTE